MGPGDRARPDTALARPGPHPRSAYLKAFLIKISEGKTFVTEPRAYLVEHPLLVLEIGFPPVPAPERLYGFDVERTVPCVGWLREQLRGLDEALQRARASNAHEAIAA